MLLSYLPMLFVLVGLALYTVLGGADMGAGLWQLLAGRGPDAVRLRDHAHHSIGPVWEANHVWLIFVLTVLWTTYPTAFGSILSTLSVPFFLAAVGIVFRGAAYALQSGTSAPRERRVIDTVFALSSILTPFALGAAVGGIASRRVPVGNAAGNLITSWLNPTSILVGVLAVLVAAFLAAVYLCSDAVRIGEPELARRFRARAVGTGLITGAVSLVGLAVLHTDAPPLFDGLVHWPGLAAVITSGLAGIATLPLLWHQHTVLPRAAAALAVAAIIAGWALAQQPVLLPGLTVAQAASPESTMIAVVVAVLAGAVILFPSLALLFGLVLHGRFDPGAATPAQHIARSTRSARGPLPRGWLAVGCLLLGAGLLVLGDSGWAHAAGVLCLAGFMVLGYLACAPSDIAADDPARASG
ncbi:MAG TPA: cytochrome d ubiquinol oxidase subunit II [Pseudonocardia sp.]|jgi:cytochrome d ubiquinol oxidase subunit II|nr:cytochrome d ubiquinol oxidase subunit II [Pseudonocardia sp.]